MQGEVVVAGDWLDTPMPNNLFIDQKSEDSIHNEALTKVEHATQPLIIVARQMGVRLESHNASI